ncbi:hypothetical protein [Acinetobacter silvestris]|uniref:Tail fiber assembly protein n=1 Tax=Acinetobacter silvestris TaxID=1977882 RepID=A0A1Y3CFN5_9GAMM|nr:hypothetical protein [Acinetobacter silvestris]OTG65921.1 hypothetical protein B9T28_06905 [Acinetobacter silvestris]
MKVSEKDQIIMVYSFDAVDQRYVGSFEYRWVIDTGLPSQATNIQPPKITAGKTAVFNVETDKWTLVEDNRGKTVYSTTNQSESKIDYIGAIKDDFTELKPTSIFDTWNGTAWEDQRTEEEKEVEYFKQFQPLTRRQFKLVLLQNDLLTHIENSINVIEDEKMRMRIQIEYAESANFERDNESVKYMAETIGMSSEQIDMLWEQALTL